MTLIQVDPENCSHDGLCVEVCPSGLLEQAPDKTPRAIAGADEACVACGHCVAACRKLALRHERLPMPEPMRAQARGGLAPTSVEALLQSRRSCREFKPTPLERGAIQALLDVARFAPTASNSQSLRWIVVVDPAVTRRLAELAMNRLRQDTRFARIAERWDAGHDVILRGAPHLIVALAPSDSRFAEIDGATALSYIELLAYARGYGTCWAGLMMVAARSDAELRRQLSVPDGYAVSGGVMLGRPKFDYAFVPPRKDATIDWIEGGASESDRGDTPRAS